MKVAQSGQKKLKLEAAQIEEFIPSISQNSNLMNKGQAKNNGVLENPPIAAQRKSNSNRKGKSGEQKAHSKKAACSNQRER